MSSRFPHPVSARLRALTAEPHFPWAILSAPTTWQYAKRLESLKLTRDGSQNRDRQLRENDRAQAYLLNSYDENLFLEPVQAYYDRSDFFNWGYWQNDTQTQKEACETLMEKLLDSIPVKEGSILDVACGNGATTRYLTRFYRRENITGINISDKQLRRARRNAPGCRFLLMDATDLHFKDNSFHAVICVEAAFHFNTRQRFLSEAHRVLRPGGYLIVSDILFHRGVEDLAPTLHGQNWISSPVGYRRLLLDREFGEVRVIDASEECWRGYDRYFFNYTLKKLQSRETDWETFQSSMERRKKRNMSVRFYVLASGRKGRDC